MACGSCASPTRTASTPASTCPRATCSCTPADFALIGDEKALDAGLARLESIGVTDFDANLLEFEDGSRERTLDYLESRTGR